jgi:hypothetical protein
MSNREQVSVPLPAELREFVRRLAKQEDRSMASVIRRLVAAARKAEQPQSAARWRRAMGGKVQSGNFAHDSACSLVEATFKALLKAQPGSAASDLAEIAYHRGIIASCKANNSSQGLAESLMALKALGTTP